MRIDNNAVSFPRTLAAARPDAGFSDASSGNFPGDIDLDFLSFFSSFGDPAAGPNVIPSDTAPSEEVLPVESIPGNQDARLQAQLSSRPLPVEISNDISSHAQPSQLSLQEAVRKELERIPDQFSQPGHPDDLLTGRLLNGQWIPFIPPAPQLNSGGFSSDQETGGNVSGISAGLRAFIEQSLQKNRSVRVDLDDQSMVVFKISHSRVSADFLTSDQAMAAYLKQQLPELRQRLNEKNLPVGSLDYRYDTSDSRQERQSDSEQSGG